VISPAQRITANSKPIAKYYIKLSWIEVKVKSSQLNRELNREG